VENLSDQHPEKWTPLDRIRFLLDRWGEIFEPDIASSFSSGGGSGLDPRLPDMAHHSSVVELEYCLSALAIDHPALFSHLKAFRCNAEWRQVKAKIPLRLPSGRMTEIDGWRKERLVPAWVKADYVFQAEEFIEKHFRGEVFIPKDLWDGLTKPLPTSV
jgi:hypothetical protein